MANLLIELQQERDDLRKAQKALFAAVEQRAAAGGPKLMSPEEKAQDDEYQARLGDLSDTLVRIERQQREDLAIAARSSGTQLPGGGSGPDAGLRPFKTLGQQLAAVARAGQNPHATDPGLLQIQAALGLSEGVQSDGGFLIQPDFTGELLELAHETGQLYRRTDRRQISAESNGIKINAVDETSRVNGSRSGGIRAYWTAEAASLTSTKPAFRQMELSLQKLTGLYYATDEELKDVTALQSNVARWFGDEFGFKLDDAVFRGVGGGMPLGVLAHAGTVSVAKETGQAAATILKENIEKMYARMWAPSVPKAEWYINQDCWPQLFALSAVVGVGGTPVFIPANSMANAPFGALLGRPIMPIEQCETLGTVGDIVLADFSQYLTIEKGGLEAASSIHVQFLTDETVFRFILRADGQPKRNAALTPFKGTATQSSFITLATRA